MNDLLLALGTNRRARSVVGALKLPIPLPEPLARAAGPWEARPLEGESVVVSGGPLLAAITGALAEAGATVLVDDAALLATARAAAEAYARPVRVDADSRGASSANASGLASSANASRVHALVLDATAFETVEQLRAAYVFLSPRVGRLARSGRVVVIARACASTASPATNAVRTALAGMVRAIAKEVGRKGATANTLIVAEGAEARMPPVLRWLLDRRSAFVTAQPLTVTARAAAARSPAVVRPLDGQVALVTGAARGIGKATAQALAAEGARVICVDRAEDSAETSQVAQAIGGSVVLADVTAADTPQRIIDALGPRGVDIVVHNAGITRDKTLGRMSPEAWDAVLGVNLAAVIRITDALLAGALRDGGRVLCLSSVSGIAGNVGQANYSASKAALIGYVDALAAQVAPRGITANAIAPGFIETRMTAAIPLMIREAGRRLAALGQGGQPEDVAQALAFLASPGAQGITGATLRVCGGALIGA
ncbi:MAG: 3-oxoacyl-ACP reductase [Myxococcales bacterium]|nr:3-oxoacyl-ACP reductase [Myxococcales bacterium]